MKKLYTYTTTVLFVTLISCVSKKGDNVDTIVLESKTIKTSNEFFSEIEVIPLRESDNTPYLSNVSKMEVFDDGLLLCDNRGVLSFFSHNGRQLSSSNSKIGNGAGEYVTLTAFTYNSFSKNIEVVTPQSILFYDKDFNLVSQSPIPSKFPDGIDGGVFFGYIYDISVSKHLLIPNSVSENKYEIYVFDSSKDKVIRKVSFSEDVMAGITMQGICFFKKSQDNLYFSPPCVSHHLYTFDTQNMHLTKRLKLSPGENGVKEDEIKSRENDERELKDFLMRTEEGIMVKALQSQDKDIFLIKKGNRIRDWEILIYDKIKKEMAKLLLFKNGKASFPMPYTLYNNYLYAIAEYDDINSFCEGFDEEKIKVIEKPTQEDIVIIKYKLK